MINSNLTQTFFSLNEIVLSQKLVAVPKYYFRRLKLQTNECILLKRCIDEGLVWQDFNSDVCNRARNRAQEGRLGCIPMYLDTLIIIKRSGFRVLSS